MPDARPCRIGLTSKTPHADFAAIQRVAAALNIQVQRDLGPLWGIHATVEAVENPAQIPPDMSPIFIVDNTPFNVGGLHTSNDGGRAFAVVLVSRDWGLGASHECLELLVDPTGNRMTEGLGLLVVDGAVQDSAERVKYVVEVCDPMEDPVHAYTIDGTVVSDFYTPQFFDDAPTPGGLYSFCRHLVRPREVKPNGYLSWLTPRGTLQQLRWFGTPAIIDLPDHSSATMNEGLSHRQFIDRHTPTPRMKAAAHR
jgi:hypothetical protein